MGCFMYIFFFNYNLKHNQQILYLCTENKQHGTNEILQNINGCKIMYRYNSNKMRWYYQI